jgi:hypothetical protein
MIVKPVDPEFFVRFVLSVCIQEIDARYAFLITYPANKIVEIAKWIRPGQIGDDIRKKYQSQWYFPLLAGTDEFP